MYAHEQAHARASTRFNTAHAQSKIEEVDDEFTDEAADVQYVVDERMDRAVSPLSLHLSVDAHANGAGANSQPRQSEQRRRPQQPRGNPSMHPFSDPFQDPFFSNHGFGNFGGLGGLGGFGGFGNFGGFGDGLGLGFGQMGGFGDFGGFGGFGDFGSPSGGNGTSTTRFYSSTSYGNGTKPIVIEKTASRVSHNGVVQETRTERDSRSNFERIELKREVGGKSKVVEKRRIDGGEIETHEQLNGVEEGEDFEETWRRHTNPALCDEAEQHMRSIGYH